MVFGIDQHLAVGPLDGHKNSIVCGLQFSK